MLEGEAFQSIQCLLERCGGDAEGARRQRLARSSGIAAIIAVSAACSAAGGNFPVHGFFGAVVFSIGRIYGAIFFVSGCFRVITLWLIIYRIGCPILSGSRIIGFVICHVRRSVIRRIACYSFRIFCIISREPGGEFGSIVCGNRQDACARHSR